MLIRCKQARGGTKDSELEPQVLKELVGRSSLTLNSSLFSAFFWRNYLKVSNETCRSKVTKKLTQVNSQMDLSFTVILPVL
jgi:hypothetical protein